MPSNLVVANVHPVMFLKQRLRPSPARQWVSLSAAAALLLLPAAARAADLPESVLPQGVGVNIHFTRGNETDLDLMAAAGFKFIRMDFGWEATERVKGDYSWTAYETLTANLEQRGLRAIYILDYSNGLYERGASPQHPESVAAFARWAGAAAAHFKGRRIVWEIWNEPNGSFWKPKPDVAQYIAVAQAACRAIRENDPHATIIAPASSEFPWAFLEKLCASGLLEQLDAVSVHPYRDYRRPPETASEDYLKLRGLIQRYASPGKQDLPILSGEWGYSTHNRGVSLDTQAAWMVRQQLANLWLGVPLSIWYDWKDDGPDPAEVEHHFGTVFADRRPKPAYEAVRVMTRELSGYRVARRIETGSPAAFVLLLVDPAGHQKLAAWSLAGERSARVDLGLEAPGDLTIVNGKGEAQAVVLEHGALKLALSPLPEYITLKQTSRPLSTAAAWTVERGGARTVVAGVKGGVTVPLKLKNPFPYAATAEAVMAGPGFSDRRSLNLAAGQSAGVTLSGMVSRRDVSQVPVTLTLSWRDGQGHALGAGAETLTFGLANLIKLAAAPTEHGLRVTVDNESALPFTGSVEVGNERHPLALSAGQRFASVDFVAHPAGAEWRELACRLLAKNGDLAAETSAKRLQLLPAAKYAARIDGDAKVPGKSSVQESPPPADDSPYATVFALDYQFDEGWRFTRCEADRPLSFEAGPKAFGVWVYGDNSGNSLRLRVRDASGQTFQVGGPHLDWTGWRWVTFDLQDLANCGHWGGANDGAVKGNLTLDTALLLDAEGRQTSGKLYFAGPAVVY